MNDDLLIKKASQQLGLQKSALERAIKQNDLQGLADKVDIARLKAVLNDPNALKALLESSRAKELMQQLSKE